MTHHIEPHPLSWLDPQDVISLENFDFPQAHVRSEFNPERIASLTSPRMVGSRVKMTLREIRDILRLGDFSDDSKAYLREVFKQCDVLDMKLFHYSCGASLYELARAMIASGIRQPSVVEWINCRTPNHHAPKEDYHRWYSDRTVQRLG